MNHGDPLFIQGVIICAIGGLAYGIMMIVIFVKVRRSGVMKPKNMTKSGQPHQYWLEEDGMPSRSGPGHSIVRDPDQPAATSRLSTPEAHQTPLEDKTHSSKTQI